MRRWGIVLMLIGMCVFAFPQLQLYYEDLQQQKLLASLNEFTDAASVAPVEDVQLESPDSSGYMESSVPETFSLVKEAPKVDHAPAQPVKTVVKSSSADSIAKVQALAPPIKKKPATMGIGILEISKINVRLPILEGASNANLNVGAAHLAGTAAIGNDGNTVIAAHHSYKYGRMFNRLQELAAGDIVTIQNGNQTLQYKVTGSEMVEPTDISVLDQPAKGKHLTLITCDNDGSHRLIVRADLQ
ncbi:class D sortase [Paenibacillus sp. GP183]|uniref:class D sortase n=1 Tax=Paenibacillus sp. GP183 TaxID=1882751 RepID=UPI00089A31F2|nr:class D sortase [Paenibacillus sp. GP183]SEB70133.1 sortase A [Paenibacillus sp. GP183]